MIVMFDRNYVTTTQAACRRGSGAVSLAGRHRHAGPRDASHTPRFLGRVAVGDGREGGGGQGAESPLQITSQHAAEGPLCLHRAAAPPPGRGGAFLNASTSCTPATPRVTTHMLILALFGRRNAAAKCLATVCVMNTAIGLILLLLMMDTLPWASTSSTSSTLSLQTV